jgi:CelD/BcsL family acetyltransferase involved in cellulose biosynthesis
MLLQWYEEPGDVDALQAEWSALLPRCATNTLFVTWEWQRAWWATFGAGRHLRVLAMRDDDGTLQAIAPLFAQQSLLDPHASLPRINIENPLPLDQGEPYQTLHFVGGSEVSDYLDIVAPADVHATACAALLDALSERPDWQITDLRSLPAASPTIRNLPEQARARGWEVQLARDDVCPVLDLPETWDEYLAERLDKKERHELRRKMRKAEREVDVNWHWVGADQLEHGLEVFFELHRASHPEKDAFMTPRMEGFFRDVAQVAQESGWLRLAVLRYDGQAVASYLCFDYGGDRLVYNSGFDTSTYGSLSPGVVLLGFMIDDAIQNGCRRFDFLQGDERYKYDLGARDTEVMRLFIRR